jgi:type IV pilus assembly protein PilW
MLLIASGAARDRARGYSIVELMVAITIGLMILAALTTMYANNSRARTEVDRANQQTENGRYALQILTDDLRNAGYYAEFNPTTLALPTTKPDPCSTTAANLTAALPVAVEGYYNAPATTAAPSCISDLRTGTDILVVRRASTCAVGDAGCDVYAAGDFYLQASSCNNPAELGSASIANWYALTPTLASLTLHQKDCATVAPYHQYEVHIYFIANNDKAGDGIPTLKRAELGLNGGNLAFNIVPLVEGVENMRIEYGLDTTVPTTGAPAAYTPNPDTYNGCAVAVCVGYWANAVAARINLLTRNTTPTPGYTDAKSYTLGLNADGSANVVGPLGGGFKRHVYNSLVRINNVSGRNTP